MIDAIEQSLLLEMALLEIHRGLVFSSRCVRSLRYLGPRLGHRAPPLVGDEDPEVWSIGQSSQAILLGKCWHSWSEHGWLSDFQSPFIAGKSILTFSRGFYQLPCPWLAWGIHCKIELMLREPTLYTSRNDQSRTNGPGAFGGTSQSSWGFLTVLTWFSFDKQIHCFDSD